MKRELKKGQPAYESREATENAIERIHGHFSRAKAAGVARKKFEESPAGLLRLSLQTLLRARKALTRAGEDIDRSITAIQAASTEFFPHEAIVPEALAREGKKSNGKKPA